MKTDNTKEINAMKLVDNLREITDLSADESDAKRENANVNGNSSMGMMLQMGSTVGKTIGLSQIEEKYSKLHSNGDIHIHDLDFYPTGTATCCQIDLNKLFTGGFNTGHGHIREPKDIRTYSALAAIAIQSNQNDQHGGQSIPMFDYYLAPGVSKTYINIFWKQVYQFLSLISTLEDEELTIRTDNILSQIDNIKTIEVSDKIKKELEDALMNEVMIIDTRVKGKELVTMIKSGVENIFKQTLKDTNREVQQAMEAFIHNLNTMHSRAGAQVPFSSINFGTDTSLEGQMITYQVLNAIEAGLGNGETAIFPIAIFKVKEGINLNEGDVNHYLFKKACEVSGKRLFPNFSFLDAPHNLQYYDETDPNTEISYMGCRTRTISNVHGDNVVTSRGNISFTSINLPRLALNITNGKPIKQEDMNEKLEVFFKDLEEITNIVIEQLLERFIFQANKKVKNFPFLMGEGVWAGSDKLGPEDTLEKVLREGSLSVGFIGLAETLVALTGKHHGEDKFSAELGEKIIGRMRELTDEATEEYKMNIALIATPAEGLSGRFVRMDKEKFGEIEGVTSREYYTNSFHVPVYYQTNAYEKMSIEAPYHALTNGGHISYIEVDGDISSNVEAFEKIIKTMAKSGIGYGSINHPVDRDPVCGFTGIIGDTCPSCGRDPKEEIRNENFSGGRPTIVKIERIRRITGYLTGDVDNFNSAKASEEKDRVKHFRKNMISSEK